MFMKMLNALAQKQRKTNMIRILVLSYSYLIRVQLSGWPESEKYFATQMETLRLLVTIRCGWIILSMKLDFVTDQLPNQPQILFLKNVVSG